MSTLNVLYLLMASMCANLFLVSYFQKRGKEQNANVASLFCIVKPTVIVIFAQTNDIAPLHLLIFALLTMLVGIILTHIRKNALFLGITSLSLSVGLYVLIVEQLHLSNNMPILGIIYAVIATGWYTLATHFKKTKADLAICALSSSYFFLLSTLFIQDVWRYQFFNALTMTIVTFSAAYQFDKKELVYLGNVLMAFAVFTLLQLMHVHNEFYPLVFVMLSFAFYLVSSALTKEPKEEFRNSGLLGAVLAPMVFGLYSYSSGYDYGYYDYATQPTHNHLLELNSLISAYATFLLYGFDAFSRKSRRMGYVASAIGLVTYLWQINFLGVKEMQDYTFVIGAYFFTLAYIQRKRRNASLKQLFDITATFFLLVPTWIQTFDANGATYALVLGLIGVCYLVYSITYQDKLYRYGGILAIVLAVVSQSKWAIIGLAGLAFLGFALYLLIYRKDDPEHKQKIDKPITS